ncbi:helix-turn-helix transcriptional regulator [Mameliella alba]|nr:helix-turn-helix transcriptional regulator [Mameliella alba]MBY6171291.1 helix-turn-helix transcriptional regulator [Mameliella alba]MBY6176515.1 helix-turn-helix transcriptional regulator [Mameliella alba]
MRRNELSEEYCSIARAGADIADAWTFLILRELFLSNRSFEGLRRQTGMAPGSLTQRLTSLEEAGILRRDAPEGKPRKAQYVLTEKGLDLWPVVIALKQWGDKWFGPWQDGLPPVSLEHRGRDHPLIVQTVCACCGEPVTAMDSTPVINPVFGRNRDQREDMGKRARRKETKG